MLLEQNLEFQFRETVISCTGLDKRQDLAEQLISFREFGQQTLTRETKALSFEGAELTVPTYVNEFWTSRQRAASFPRHGADTR